MHVRACVLAPPLQTNSGPCDSSRAFKTRTRTLLRPPLTQQNTTDHYVHTHMQTDMCPLLYILFIATQQVFSNTRYMNKCSKYFTLSDQSPKTTITQWTTKKLNTAFNMNHFRLNLCHKPLLTLHSSSLLFLCTCAFFKCPGKIL